MGWRHEIIEMQGFLEAWYLGREQALDRVEEALHPAFSFAGPNGESADRATALDLIRNGHGHTAQLRIITSDHQLLHRTPEVIVAAYVERHELARGDNERLCTVVFTVEDDGPNGLRWLRTHESWIRRLPNGG